MKTLVTGALQATESELKMLESLGCDVIVHGDEKALVKNPEQYETVICNGLFLYNKIEDFTALKQIQLTSAGFDRVPMDYAQAHGVKVYNAAGVYSIPMAEWTLMRVLESYKNADRLFACSTWQKDRTWRELDGKTALIVGCGAYGTQTAKRLKAFGVHTVIANRTVKPNEYADELYTLDALDELLKRADILIMCIALTDKTRHIINAERLDKLKDGALVVNAARGGLIDEKALISELETGRISAALDVFETEPLHDDSPLRSMKNVLISPHNSFVGEKNHARLFECVINNLK